MENIPSEPIHRGPKASNDDKRSVKEIESIKRRLFYLSHSQIPSRSKMSINYLSIDHDDDDMELSTKYYRDPFKHRMRIHLPNLVGARRLCRVLKADETLSNLKPYALEPRRSSERKQKAEDVRQSMLGLINVDHASDLRIDLVDGDPRIQLLLKKLKDFKSLSSLTLHIRDRAISGLDQETVLLLQNVRYLPSLAHLTLRFFNIRIKEKTVAMLLPNSHHLPLLSSLSLLGVFTANDMKSLVPYLKSLKSLSSLNIKLTSCNCSERDILSLFGSLNSLKNLAKVTIHVYPRMKYEGPTNPYLINLGRPSALNLAFSSPRIRDQEVADLLETLRYFESLSTVCFKLSHCRLSSIAVQNLSATIKKFEWLNTLVLDISSCEQTIYKHIGAMFDALAVLKGISTLALSCDFSEPISKKAMESLGSSLNHLEKLTTLKLSFLKAQQMTDAKALSVLSDLGHLSSLTSLSLNFTFCEQLSNNVIYSIAWSLKFLRLLHKVELEFCYCDKITDRGV